MASVNDRECPFMSLPALSLPLFRLFSFVPSVITMLQGTLVIQSLSVSSLQFVVLRLLLHRLRWFPLSFTLFLHPSLVPALCCVLALVLFSGICDSVITSDFGGKAAGAFFSTETLSGGSASESRPI